MIKQKPFYLLQNNTSLENDFKNIFYYHVEKCAGTTLVSLLINQAKSALRVYGSLYNLYNSEGLVKKSAYSKIINNEISEKDKIADFIVGHLPFGSDKHFERNAFFRIASLRDPIARSISMYNMHIQRSLITREDEINELYKSDLMHSNYITRFFSGTELYKTKATEEHYINAVNNIRKLDVVFDASMLIETVSYLQSYCNLPDYLFQSWNVLDSEKYDYNSDFVKIVEENNQYDIMIYNEIFKKNKIIYKNSINPKLLKFNNNKNFFYSSEKIKLNNKSKFFFNNNQFDKIKKILKDNKVEIVKKKVSL